MAARVGALSATALLAVSGTFIAGPAMAGTTEPELPPATEPAVDPSTPAADPSTPAADPSTPAADPSTPAADPSTPAADPSTPAADPSTPAADPSTPAPAPSASPSAQAPSAPALSIPNLTPVVAGQSISGTAPGATALRVLWEGGALLEVPVAADGTFTITAPDEVLVGGMVDLTLYAVQGETVSAPSYFTLELLQVNQLASPVISNETFTDNSLATIAGTGTPGATVKLSIQRYTDDAMGPQIDVPVAEDGTWSFTLGAGQELSYGGHLVEAFQVQTDKIDSPVRSRTLYVSPSAPVFTTLGDGTTVPINELPEFITGTGMPGADIQVVIDVEAQYAAIENNPDGEIVVFEGKVEADGTWAVSTEGMGEGPHQILAGQAFNGAPSETAESNIVVTAATVADPADPANTGTGTGTITVTGNTGTGANLADTGAENVGLLAAGGAGLLAAGAAALFLNKRRRTVSDS